MERTWKDNAFWETPKKKILNCISEEVSPDGKIITKVMKLQEKNPLFQECLTFLGEDVIDASTVERKERKQRESEVNLESKRELQKAKKLEKLFKYKLETFEIPEIKFTKNRKLKSKLRRSKSTIEVNLYAMMILQESLKDE
jgi:hypothetical protein